MEYLALPSVGFLVVMIASLFLFGELLVRAKGIFFLIGIGIFTVYFSFHLNDTSMLWMAVVFVVGLLFVFLDGAIMNDGSVALIGLAVMALSVAVPSPSFIYAFLAIFGLLIGFGLSFFFLKVFPARNMWRRVALKEKLTSEGGFNSLNESYRSLVGRDGMTVTPFRPTGTIEVDGNQYSAITEGIWLESGVPIIVESVDGTRIVVKPKNADVSTERDDGVNS